MQAATANVARYWATGFRAMAGLLRADANDALMRAHLSEDTIPQTDFPVSDNTKISSVWYRDKAKPSQSVRRPAVLSQLARFRSRTRSLSHGTHCRRILPFPRFPSSPLGLVRRRAKGSGLWAASFRLS